MADDTEAAVEDLDVSMTRQPTILFIPFGLAAALGVGMFAGGTFFHTWKTAFLAPVLWVIAYVMTKRDHNAIRVAGVMVRLLKLWATAHRFGGWSTSLPSHRKMGGPDAA